MTIIYEIVNNIISNIIHIVQYDNVQLIFMYRFKCKFFMSIAKQEF